MARLALVALVVLCATACSSSKHSATTTTGPVRSPIVVKTPLSGTQWRSPVTVKGTSTLSGKLVVEVLDSAGKQLGRKDTTASGGRFAVKVPFTAKKLIPGTVSVHDEDKSHTVLISVVLTP
jgi:Immunoglobulin-like domain of bacterial spore germination